MRAFKSTTIRRCLLLCAFTGLCSAARPQSQAILGRDNAAFARKLFEFGYSELAEGVCKSIEAAAKDGGADGAEVRATSVLRFELRLSHAAAQPDVAARMDEIKGVLTDMDAFIADQPRTAEAGYARVLRPDVHRQLGESLTAAIQKEQDPAVVAQLRAEGQAVFADAEKALLERIQLFADQLSDPDADLQYADRQHVLATYNLARTFYFHALLYPEDDPERQRMFQKALDAFLEFGLDYGDQLLNFEGMIYQGLCSKALGNQEDALLAFEDSIALRETYDKLKDGLYDVPSDAVEIVCSATLQKVLLLSERGEHAAAVAAADDYFVTIPDALFAQNGLAVIAAKADAQLAARDFAAASESAQKLSDLDPEGRWGARGRDILGKMVGGSGVDLAPDRMLKVAETMVGRGDVARAMDVCAQARKLARGTAAEADIGADSFLLTGVAFYRTDQVYEASLAFDLGHELHPRGKKAAEALSRAASCYQLLNSQDRRPFFRKRYEDRLRKLADQYPDHPNAASAQLIEGQAFEDEEEYLQAAEVYRRVQPGSAAYEEAQFKAASCVFKQANSLLEKGKAEEARPFLKEAESLFEKHEQAIADGLQRNLDPEVQRRLRGLAFASRAARAQLYLLPAVDRTSEVAPLLASVEEEFPDDPDKIGVTWNLRIQALNAQGRLDEAVAMLDALRLKDPDAAALQTAAGVLARALDQAGKTLLDKETSSAEADQMWRSAAQYYWLSIRSQLDGKEPLRQSSVDAIATRLYVYGMHFNGVPAVLDSFVGWDGGPAKNSEYWGQSASMQEALYNVSPTYKTLIALGRNYGFLGRWKEAADVYARLFDQENLINRSTQRFEDAIVSAKPLLVFAYMEWGVAEHMQALSDNDKDRFVRAFQIFERVAENTNSDNHLWWHAKYYQVKSLMDRGLYREADIAVRNVERTTQDFDQGQFGYKDKFLALKAELAKKVRNN